VSKALPMDAITRGDHYASHPDRFTPKQTRRLWHKDGRADPGWEPVDVDIPEGMRPKGHATPRRSDAINGKRALRRFAEAQQDCQRRQRLADAQAALEAQGYTVTPPKGGRHA